MHGLMQDFPLTTVHLFERAERLFPKKEVVTSLPDGRHRYTYGDFAERTRRVGGMLDVLGISDSGRVATFGWNSYRHLELYFGIPNTGRVLHTLNIRLFADQLAYIVRHAEDEAIFVDRSLLALLWPLIERDEFTKVWHFVVMDDGKGDIPDDHRRADDLDGRAARARRPRRLEPAGHPVRRERRAQGAERGLPRQDGPPHPPGVGHDGDVADRQHRPHQVRPRRDAGG
jgi:acyl-CoA synthetase (AMP-forming)/AMP-acid ligase II